MADRDLLLDFRPAFEYKEGIFKVLNQELMDSIGGVYACYVGFDLKYVGSYSNSLQQRWINKKHTKFVHFKADILKEMANGDYVKVYCLPIKDVKSKYKDSPLVTLINQESVESRIIEMFNPPLNVVKKNDKNKSSKSGSSDSQTPSS